ncbi:hypothetical protein ANO11243_071760 [Dothideomycetidae sp. 11243]|nr:hypothetical protein ANO11243_071760 [fungal sp. No.11243]
MNRTRSKSPIAHIAHDGLSKACKCILEENDVAGPAQASSKPLIAHKPTKCNPKLKKQVSKEYKNPKALCKFFQTGQLTNNISPIPGLTVPQIFHGCQCIAPQSHVSTEVPSATDSDMGSTATGMSDASSATDSGASATDSGMSAMTTAVSTTMATSTSLPSLSCASITSSATAMGLNKIQTDSSADYSQYSADFTNLYTTSYRTANAQTTYTSFTMDGSANMNDVASSCAASAVYMQNINDPVGLNVFFHNGVAPYWGCIVFQWANASVSTNAVADLQCSWGFWEKDIIQQ